MLHPLIGRGDEQTRRYHLSNVVGNPYQTTAAACSLIAGGVLDEVPGLQVLLVHGGRLSALSTGPPESRL